QATSMHICVGARKRCRACPTCATNLPKRSVGPWSWRLAVTSDSKGASSAGLGCCRPRPASLVQAGSLLPPAWLSFFDGGTVTLRSSPRADPRTRRGDELAPQAVEQIL